MHASWRVGLATAVAAVLAAPAPGSASGTPGQKAIWGPVTRNGVSEFPLYQAMGVGIYQTNIVWNNVAPTRPAHPRDTRDPAYHWPSEIDYAIQQAAAYHMRVLIRIDQSPGWANGGRAPKYAPRRPGDLADFFAAAARRYPAVHLWMVWGEPTNPDDFAPLPSRTLTGGKLTRAQAWAPHHYAQMLDASYAALKGVSSRNLVIGGDSYTSGRIPPFLWIRYLRLPNGHPPRMDLYGHNPFTGRPPNLSNPPSPFDDADFSDLGRLEQAVNRNLAPRPPPHHTARHIKLFLSEWSIPTAPGDSRFSYWVDPPVAAKWVADAWTIVHHHSFIYALGWIDLYDGPGDTGGLFDALGNPKPVYYPWKAG